MRKLSVVYFALFLGAGLSGITGCTSKDSPVETYASDDKQAIILLAEQDEDVSSFEPGFNESEAMAFTVGKVNTNIYPVRVGQKMTLASKTWDVSTIGDTSYATVIKTFNGTLIVAARYNQAGSGVDTVIRKDFTSTITHKAIFVRKDNSNNPLKNWKLIAVSMAQGGTLNSPVVISKMTAVFPDKTTLEITSPTDYYLYKTAGKKKMLPNIGRDERVTLRVEVKSASADSDFVSITYGADMLGNHRAKQKFALISSVQDGQIFTKVYEGSFPAHQFMGHYHAIVNAYPLSSVFDDSAAVGCSSWGFPYWVNR